MRYVQVLTALAAACLTTACHGVDSSTVATHQIRAEMTLTADGYGETEVVVQLEARNHTLGYVELEGGEQMVVHARGYDLPLDERWLDYHTDVPTDRGETEFQIRLERVYDVHAPDSWVRMPQGFHLYRNPGVYLLDWDVIPIEWDVISDDAMTVAVDGPCIDRFEEDIAPRRDVGALVLRPGDLYVDEYWDGELCELTVTVERRRPGQVDSAFGGGFITATQVRESRILVEY